MTTIEKFIHSVNKYLIYLSDHYKLNEYVKKSDNLQDNCIKLLKSSDDLSTKIDLIRSFPDFGNHQLKYMKNQLLSMVVDLEILNNTKNCIESINNDRKYEKLEKSHTKLEKWFNNIYNGSFLILQLDNNMYALELDTDFDTINDKGPYNTFYNYLSNDITGTLTLWDMKITSEKYKYLAELSSSDEDDEGLQEEEYDINNRQLVNTYDFTSKTNIIEFLGELEKEGYSSL